MLVQRTAKKIPQKKVQRHCSRYFQIIVHKWSLHCITKSGMWKRLFFNRFRFRFHTYHFRSSISAKTCTILHALCWSRQHQQVCHFSSFLLLSDSRSVFATLFSPSSFLLPQSLSETVSSLLQFYQATMGPRTLVSSGRRRG